LREAGLESELTCELPSSFSRSEKTSVFFVVKMVKLRRKGELNV
jgi:hypothetical protein